MCFPTLKLGGIDAALIKTLGRNRGKDMENLCSNLAIKGYFKVNRGGF
jgi:hypothetical protein